MNNTQLEIGNYKVLIVGTGGREAAITAALKRSRHNIEIVAIGNNQNPTMIQNNVKIISLNHVIEIANYAKDNNFNMVIVGPEQYLNDGVANELNKLNIPCIGPTKELARIETDKFFARKLLNNLGDGHFNPIYKEFNKFDQNEIHTFLETINNSFVVKNIGLCGGKGVKVMGRDFITVDEGLQYCKELIDTTGICLIEEKLEGIEFSLMTFTDGFSFSHMPIVHDYKRLNNNDLGPQTGGMGCITNNSLDNNNFMNPIKRLEIELFNEIVILELQKECGQLYKGIIYGSYMLTNNGNIKVIEYNCRFGDPESINVLSLLSTDFMDICCHISNSKLKDIEIKYQKNATCVIYAVPTTYPISAPEPGNNIIITDNTNYNELIFANTDMTSDTNKYKLLKSRSLAVIGKGENLIEAYTNGMGLIQQISGPIYYRTDIGRGFISFK
jgi:phosphoribosylamine--glycine ligase